MKKVFLSIVAIFLLMQLIRVDQINYPIEEAVSLKAPKKVETILQRSCYDCHSNQTKWPWYSAIAPLSWSIASHVKEGRKALNFSIWQKIDPKIKEKRLKRLIQTTQNGMMPLPSYLWFHKEAKLDKTQKQIVKEWANQELEKLHHR